MADRYTSQARRAIELAVEATRELRHGYVGTEHLLLGLLREGNGVAARVLESHDVTEEKIVELIDKLLSTSAFVAVDDDMEYSPVAARVL